MMKALRILAVLLALSLMLGEIWRSWGADRPIMFILDDQLMGTFLVVSAWVVRHRSARNHAVFSAGWAVNAGMLYGSFFGKVFDPTSAQPGTWDLGILTALIGVALTVSVFGLVCSLIMIQPTVSNYP